MIQCDLLKKPRMIANLGFAFRRPSSNGGKSLRAPLYSMAFQPSSFKMARKNGNQCLRSW